MNQNRASIDLLKLAKHILKYWWVIVLCAAIGFGFMYWRTNTNRVETYTASGTMYVYNANPNLVNYGYTSSSDLNSAVRLLDTYVVVVKSNKVLDVVVERLTPDYPDITANYIAATLSMGSVSETGVVRVSCRTNDPQKSADICNAVMDVAPAEIIRVVSAGSAEIIDYATPPAVPDGFSPSRRYMIGALGGAAAAAAVLTLLFLLDFRVRDTKELTERYTLPVLASIKREKEDSTDPGRFLLNENSPMNQTESYAKLRMNMLFTLTDKKKHSVIVSSAISGEGKTTIAANLAISVAMSGKKVLLVDADMRRACLQEVFHYKRHLLGLSNILVGSADWRETLVKTEYSTLQILPAGLLPPNPAELLESTAMQALMEKLESEYDLILLDVPPINIVSDPLALSSLVAGGLFVVRQAYSDHREIRKALTQAEMTGLDLLGFAFYGEKVEQESYYNRKYYSHYYHKYDTRSNSKGSQKTNNASTAFSRRNENGTNGKAAVSASSSDSDGTAYHRRSRK